MLHLMKGYKKYNKETLPNTEFIGSHCASIPLYPGMTEEEINYVIEQTKQLAMFVK